MQLKKSEVKLGKSAISGQFRCLVPVPLTRTRLVQVSIQVVPVPLLPAALIFGILTLLSSNLLTEGIGTLIND